MKNIILYGAPAAGKGTACHMLASKYGYNHISTGDLFRSLDDSTEIGKTIKETIEAGNLVDDETTNKLVKSKLDTLNGLVVLDGFPRNLKQAKMLDEYFNDYIVVNLEVSYEEARKRALGRLNCPNCGKGYNKFNPDMLPKHFNLCDNCGVELNHRSDDNEESFKKRFEIYTNNLKDVLDYYKEKKLLYIVESVNADDTFKNIEGVIN